MNGSEIPSLMKMSSLVWINWMDGLCDKILQNQEESEGGNITLLCSAFPCFALLLSYSTACTLETNSHVSLGAETES